MTAKSERHQGDCVMCLRPRMLDSHDLCGTCRRVALVPDSESPAVLDEDMWVVSGGIRRYVGSLTC